MQRPYPLMPAVFVRAFHDGSSSLDINSLTITAEFIRYFFSFFQWPIALITALVTWELVAEYAYLNYHTQRHLFLKLGWDYLASDMFTTLANTHLHKSVLCGFLSQHKQFGCISTNYEYDTLSIHISCDNVLLTTNTTTIFSAAASVLEAATIAMTTATDDIIHNADDDNSSTSSAGTVINNFDRNTDTTALPTIESTSSFQSSSTQSSPRYVDELSNDNSNNGYGNNGYDTNGGIDDESIPFLFNNNNNNNNSNHITDSTTASNHSTTSTSSTTSNINTSTTTGTGLSTDWFYLQLCPLGAEEEVFARYFDLSGLYNRLTLNYAHRGRGNSGDNNNNGNNDNNRNTTDNSKSTTTPVTTDCDDDTKVQNGTDKVTSKTSDNIITQSQSPPSISHSPAGWCSWYHYFEKINEFNIQSNLRDFQTIRVREKLHFHQQNFKLFQIDDGYQVAWGDWLIIDKKKFPTLSMRKLVEMITATAATNTTNNASDNDTTVNTTSTTTGFNGIGNKSNVTEIDSKSVENSVVVSSETAYNSVNGNTCRIDVESSISSSASSTGSNVDTKTDGDCIHNCNSSSNGATTSKTDNNINNDTALSSSSSSSTITSPIQYQPQHQQPSNHRHQQQPPLQAGLWLAPFACDKHSRLAATRAHWILKREGSNFIHANSANCGKWFCGLDITNIDVQEYVRDCLRVVLQDWGFTYLKLDFLYAACLKTQSHSRAVTRAEAMQMGMSLINDCIAAASNNGTSSAAGNQSRGGDSNGGGDYLNSSGNLSRSGSSNAIDTIITCGNRDQTKSGNSTTKNNNGSQSLPTPPQQQHPSNGQQHYHPPQPIFFLGCGSPLGATIGHVDANRVSADAGLTWLPESPLPQGDEWNLPCARNTVRNTINRLAMHGRWWINDPDCLILSATTSFTNAEIQGLATVKAFSGGSLLISDDLSTVSEYRLLMLKKILPILNHHQAAVAMDLLERSSPELLKLQMMSSYDNSSSRNKNSIGNRYRSNKDDINDTFNNISNNTSTNGLMLPWTLLAGCNWENNTSASFQSHKKDIKLHQHLHTVNIRRLGLHNQLSFTAAAALVLNINNSNINNCNNSNNKNDSLLITHVLMHKFEFWSGSYDYEVIPLDYVHNNNGKNRNNGVSSRSSGSRSHSSSNSDDIISNSGTSNTTKSDATTNTSDNSSINNNNSTSPLSITVGSHDIIFGPVAFHSACIYALRLQTSSVSNISSSNSKTEAMYLGSNFHFSCGREVVSAVHQRSGSSGYSTALDDEIRNRFRQLMMASIVPTTASRTTTTATPASTTESHNDNNADTNTSESTGTDSNSTGHAINCNKNNHTNTPINVNSSSLLFLASTATQPMQRLTILFEDYVRDIARDEEKYVTVFLPLNGTQYTALEVKYNSKNNNMSGNNDKPVTELKSPVKVKVNTETASSSSTNTSDNITAAAGINDDDGDDCNCTILYAFTNMLTLSHHHHPYNSEHTNDNAYDKTNNKGGDIRHNQQKEDKLKIKDDKSEEKEVESNNVDVDYSMKRCAIKLIRLIDETKDCGVKGVVVQVTLINSHCNSISSSSSSSSSSISTSSSATESNNATGTSSTATVTTTAATASAATNNGNSLSSIPVSIPTPRVEIFWAV